MKNDSPQAQEEAAKRDDYDLAYKIVDQMGFGFEFRNCRCGQLPCLRLKPIVDALAKREAETRAEGDHVHWLFKRGAEETMCGRETAEVKTSLLADCVTCPFCNVAFCGYKLGRAEATPRVETGLTVEACLAELRELMPHYHFRITFCYDSDVNLDDQRYCNVAWIDPESGEDKDLVAATLDEAMQEVRAWAKSRAEREGE